MARVGKGEVDRPPCLVSVPRNPTRNRPSHGWHGWPWHRRGRTPSGMDSLAGVTTQLLWQRGREPGQHVKPDASRLLAGHPLLLQLVGCPPGRAAWLRAFARRHARYRRRWGAGPVLSAPHRPCPWQEFAGKSKGEATWPHAYIDRCWAPTEEQRGRMRTLIVAGLRWSPPQCCWEGGGAASGGGLGPCFRLPTGPYPGGNHGPHRRFQLCVLRCHSWAARQEEQRGFQLCVLACHARCWEDNGRRRGPGSCA